jgi:hypothetical protein
MTDRRIAHREDARMSTKPIIIYGASDDLVEVDGRPEVAEEYGCWSKPCRLRLTAPDGMSLDVVAQFGRRDARLDWTTTVEAVNAYPSWPIRFIERPDREGDPAVEIDAPEGTTVVEIGGDAP